MENMSGGLKAVSLPGRYKKKVTCAFVGLNTFLPFACTDLKVHQRSSVRRSGGIAFRTDSMAFLLSLSYWHSNIFYTNDNEPLVTHLNQRQLSLK